jgi:hypothetical protein
MPQNGTAPEVSASVNLKIQKLYQTVWELLGAVFIMDAPCRMYAAEVIAANLYLRGWEVRD